MSRRLRLLPLVQWLLRHRLPEEWAEFVLGDLEEGYHRRRRQSSFDASVWLLKQTLVCLASPAPASSRRLEPLTAPRIALRPGHLLRSAWRTFRARPLLTVSCIGILAAGIGSATAVSAAVYALLIRPLPLPASERLVSGYALREGFDPFGTSLAEYNAFKTRVASFESIGVARNQTSTLRAGGETVRVQAAAVTSDYLSTAGVVPALGRTISPADDRPGSSAVVVISHSLWVRHFAGQSDVVGRSLTIDGGQATVIGVLPPRFDLPSATEIWVPLQVTIDALPLQDRLASTYMPLARLRPGAAIGRANQEIATIVKALAEEYPQRRGWTYRAIGLRQQLLGDLDGRTTRIVGLVVTAVVFLLVLCCVNVANLVLLRAADRERDEAIRVALGASGGQLTLERLAESLAIGLAGGAAGLALTTWLAPLLSALNPVRPAAFGPALTDFRVDSLTIAIGATVSAVTTILTAIVSHTRSDSRAHVAATLAASGPRTGLGRARRTRLRLLVASQIAVAVLLLVGSGLVLRSFAALRDTDIGFRTRGIASSQLTLPPRMFTDHVRRAADLERLVASVREIPGITNAGITTNIPLQRGSFDSFFTVEGRVVENPNDVPITGHRVVTPGYLRLLGVRLMKGRLLSESDTAAAPLVVVITEELARQAWPGEEPLGRRIRRGRASDTTNPWLTVVGVVRDVKEDRFNFRTNRAAWYLPYAQQNSSAPPNLVIESEADFDALTAAVRRRVRAFDPDVAASELVAFDVHVAGLIVTERFAAVMLSALACAGLLLAVIGLYGAISHIVSAQQSEIALRIAVGAARGRVVVMVVREVMLVAVWGTITGGLVAAVGANGLSTVLYEVRPHDAITYGSVAVLLIVVSVAAAFVPALRAARVDPAGLLR
ncbi:MAG TPA: ADOP family duplicated permease [Vicinamibacterales bacterium]|nr:ADOP family duplicated permease [Vicinamibacterales bacterium]